MIEELEGCEPLSQVWFVHDYIQLQFQDRTVSVINEPQLKLPSGGVLYRNSAGFCDALVGQIGQSVKDATLREKEVFTLTFENGAMLIVPLTPEAANGPEAIELPGVSIVFNA